MSLVTLLRSPDERRRGRAAKQLLEMLDPNGTAALLDAVATLPVYYLAPITHAISEAGDRRFISPLLSVLQADHSRDYESYLAEYGPQDEMDPWAMSMAEVRAELDFRHAGEDFDWLMSFLPENEIDEENTGWELPDGGQLEVLSGPREDDTGTLSETSVIAAQLLQEGMVSEAVEMLADGWRELEHPYEMTTATERYLGIVETVLETVSGTVFSPGDEPSGEDLEILEQVLVGEADAPRNSFNTMPEVETDDDEDADLRDQLQDEFELDEALGLSGPPGNDASREFIHIVREVRVLIIQTLQGLRDVRAIETLRELVTSQTEDRSVRKRAEEALHDLSKQHLTCPFCRFTIYISAEAHHICDDCGVVMHEECWDLNEGCPSWGCDSAPLRDERPEDEEPELEGLNDEAHDDMDYDDLDIRLE